MKPKLKLFFCDFWSVFDPKDNYFLDLIKDDYDIEINDKDPDFVFYSVFGTQHYRYDCPKIFYTGENVRPDFTYCDYAFSFDYSDNPANYRLPLYPFFDDVSKLLIPKDIEAIIAQKRKFCNFVYSNASQSVRNNFFKKLNAIKKVDSAGRLYNNTKFRAPNKVEFVKDYKFTIAFENESYPGYTTEKIFEPMLVSSIPIYWGNPLVGRDFNSKSFLSYYDFPNEDALIERILEIDADDALYAEYLKQPFFVDNKLNEFVEPENVRRRLIEIFSTKIIPKSSRMLHHTSCNPLMQATSLFALDSKYFLNNYLSRAKKANLTKIKLKIKRKFEGK